MTNPDNIVRVRARNGGRASVYEANGWCQAYSSGLLKGNGVVQNTSADMNVLVGGSASKPDVVLAENPAGYKVALDLVGQKPVTITAPASNSRISAIVAYTDDLSLATTEDTITGSPASCGLIVVNGTASSSPVEPTDNQIRTAITADGATGSQAAYVVIATILVANDTTIITDSLITNKKAAVGAANIDFTTFGYSIEEKSVGSWIDGKIIYKKTIYKDSIGVGETSILHGITDLDLCVKVEAFEIATPHTTLLMPALSNINGNFVSPWTVSDTNIRFFTTFALTDVYITLYYTKIS